MKIKIKQNATKLYHIPSRKRRSDVALSDFLIVGVNAGNNNLKFKDINSAVNIMTK